MVLQIAERKYELDFLLPDMEVRLGQLLGFEVPAPTIHDYRVCQADKTAKRVWIVESLWSTMIYDNRAKAVPLQ